MPHFEVHLRDTVTGDARVYQDDNDIAEMEDPLFIWSEGNYSCDCNRSLFLWDWQQKAIPCGNGRIVIDKIVVHETGETVYSELVCHTRRSQT